MSGSESNKNVRGARSCSRANARAALAAAAVAVICTSPVHAANKAWDTSGNANANFSGANWSASAVPAAGGSQAAASGDTLFFGTAVTTGLTNDLTGASFAGLTFISGASAFTIGGNSFTLAGNVTNSSTNLQTINNAIALSGVSTFTMTTGGGNITLGAAISGAGGSITTVGTGTATLTLGSTGSSYSGATTIGSGTLSVSTIGNSGSNSSLGTNGTINIGATTTGGTLLYTGTGETSDKVINLAGTTGGATINQSGASGNLKFGTNLTATGSGVKTLTLTGSTAGTGEISGNIVNSGGGATSVTKNGSGTWTLSGTNSYSGLTNLNGASGTLIASGTNSSAGATTVQSGTLVLNNTTNGGIASGLLTLGSGGALSVTTASGVALSNTVSLAAGSGGFGISGAQNVTLNGDVTYVGNSDKGFNNLLTGGATLTLGGALILNTVGANIYNSTSGTTTTINGVVSTGGSATSAGALTNSSGTLVLTNSANSYAGVTTIGGGTVSVANIGNSGSNSNLGTNGTINISNSSTSGTLLYTGTGETSDKVINLAGTTLGATITQGGTGSLKFSKDLTATGAGIKTLTLSGSTLGTGEISGKIVNSTSATNLAKTGTGTWTLSGASTYSGSTSVNNGALIINNGSGSGTGAGAVTVAAAANSTTATLGGGGTISGGVSLSAPTGTGRVNRITGGDIGTIGTLTVGSLTMGSGSTFAVDLSGSAGSDSADKLTITGAAAQTSGTTALAFNTIASTGSLTLGKYVLATAGSGTGLNKTNFAATGTPTGYRLINATATELDLQHQATIGIVPIAANVNAHVGSSAAIGAKVTNIAPTDSADLAYTVTGAVSGSGTAVAGDTTGSTFNGTYTATLGVSNLTATATDVNATNSPQSANFTVTGYRLASANVTPTTVNLGIVRRGGSFGSQAIAVGNTAANDGFSESLDASATAIGSASSTGGPINVGAGLSSTAIAVGLGNASTSALGSKTGSVALALASNGTGSSGLGTTSLAGQTVNVSGQVNDFAQQTFAKTASTDATNTFAVNSPTSYTIDFGTVNGGEQVTLSLANTVLENASFQDLLKGGFNTAGEGQFVFNGSPFTQLAAGSTQGGLTIDFSSVSLANGVYSGSVLFNCLSSNTSDPTGTALSPVTLNFTANVAVPEPAALGLLGLGSVALMKRRRRVLAC